jgi:catechol 2,3-dioxygenase-like lactoylglutathione lyase family enzyme
MFIEHVAFAVSDPEAAAAWYCEHFGMRFLDHGGGGDVFVCDDRGRGMLQFEDARRVTAVPGEKFLENRSRDMRLLHLAFWADDVAGERERLLAAGATADGEVIITPAGDEMATIRDPWGLPIQILRRKVRLLPQG